MYAIHATLKTWISERNSQGWYGTRQLPIFYLDETVQGIKDEAHANHIAREILDPLHALNLDISSEWVRPTTELEFIAREMFPAEFEQINDNNMLAPELHAAVLAERERRLRIPHP